MLIVFFDAKGVTHNEFLPEGQTVKGAFYVEVLREGSIELKRRVNRVRSDITGNWKLHHENAPSHTCFISNDYLARNGIATQP